MIELTGESLADAMLSCYNHFNRKVGIAFPSHKVMYDFAMSLQGQQREGLVPATHYKRGVDEIFFDTGSSIRLVDASEPMNLYGLKLTKRENYLIAAKGGKPEWVPSVEDANMYMLPLWNEVDPETGRDMFNIVWVKDDFGMMPDSRYPALEDISQWREVVRFPDLKTLDWEKLAADFEATADPEKVNIILLNTHGPMLIPVNMLGWVEGLTAIYTDREELEAFISAITDFILETADYIFRYFKPDILCSGDDLSSAQGPLVSREIWESLYKPYFAKIVHRIHEGGALCEFHNCGKNGYLIEEYLNLGVDICQLPACGEDLLQDKARFGNRLVITGGWDRRGDAALPGASEETVRASVHTALEAYGKDGALIFWDGGIAGSSEDSQNKRIWLYDEFNRCKYDFYK